MSTSIDNNATTNESKTLSDYNLAKDVKKLNPKVIGMKKAIQKALPHLTLVLVIAAICAILEGYMSFTMMNAIDAVNLKDMLVFKQEAVKLLIIAVAMIPATILLAYSRGVYKRRAIVSAKVNFLRRVFLKNINEYQKDNTSKYVSTLTNDVNTIETNYIDGLYGIIVGSVNFFAALIVIGIASPISLIFGITVGVINALISVFTSKPLQKHQTQRSHLYEGYTTYIKEVLSAFHIIKANNLGDKVKGDFHTKSHAIQHKGFIIDKVSTLIFAAQQLTGSLSFIGLLGVISVFAIRGNLTFGAVILVVTNIGKMMQPLFEVGEWMPKLFATKKLFKKIDDTLENQDNYEETVSIDRLKDQITFENVSFSYDETPVLRDLRLELKKGGKYLVVGPSGGGKSTLLKLLRKHHIPCKGKIMIDGIDLLDITKDSYFHNISNIEQQVFLFEDTVKNNICLYKDYTDNEIEEAIRKAGLLDFIEGLPNGLESIIYDNGKNISGGEKSRIAIARGLLQKADIIFLDEAFASLDSKIASEIEKTILGLGNITVINVSHVIFEENKCKYDDVYMVKNKGVVSVLGS